MYLEKTRIPCLFNAPYQVKVCKLVPCLCQIQRQKAVGFEGLCWRNLWDCAFDEQAVIYIGPVG